MAKKLQYDILIQPIITEKSLGLVDSQNQYTFKVASQANKAQVKSAVEKKFEVTVKKIRILNKRGKRVEWGRKRIKGVRKSSRKAIVTLKGSDSIDLFKIK